MMPSPFEWALVGYVFAWVLPPWLAALFALAAAWPRAWAYACSRALPGTPAADALAKARVQLAAWTNQGVADFLAPNPPPPNKTGRWKTTEVGTVFVEERAE